METLPLYSAFLLSSAHSPAIVAAHAPHSDVDDWLAVDEAVVHWVDQAEGVLLENHHHILTLGGRDRFPQLNMLSLV